MSERNTFFLRHPSLHYCLLMVLGSFGVQVSLPIDLYPQSSVEWIDLVINLIIFVPCSIVAVISGLFAIFCAVFSHQIDEKGQFAKFAYMVVKLFGVPNLLLPEFVALNPLDLLKRVLGRKMKD